MIFPVFFSLILLFLFSFFNNIDILYKIALKSYINFTHNVSSKELQRTDFRFNIYKFWLVFLFIESGEIWIYTMCPYWSYFNVSTEKFLYNSTYARNSIFDFLPQPLASGWRFSGPKIVKKWFPLFGPIVSLQLENHEKRYCVDYCRA